MTQTIRLVGDAQRELAIDLIRKAPANAVVQISPEKRREIQNSKMWAMLSDASRSKPQGRIGTPRVWKSLFMNALGHQVEYLEGLDGEIFPTGLSTRRLSVQQMSDLIEYIYWYGAENNVQWSEKYGDE